MIDQLRNMAIFQCVAELGTFRKAAERLNLSPSVVSHHVSRLEEQLGTPLLYRSTRRMSLTEAGAKLLEATQRMSMAAADGLSAVQRQADRPSGTLKITAATPTAHSPLVENYTRFSAAYPDVHLDIHLTDSNVPLEGSGFDVAIRGRVQDLDDSSYKARKIGQLELCLFAAPSYAAARPRAASFADLSNWDWIRARPIPWSRVVGTETAQQPRIVVTADNYTLARRYVENGLGFMVEAYELVAEDIGAGRLLQLLPDIKLPQIDIYAIYPANSPKDSLAHLFVDHISANRGFRLERK